MAGKFYIKSHKVTELFKFTDTNVNYTCKCIP